MDTAKCVAALFDFDGVVMDTESQYTVFWNGVGRKYHPEYEAFGLKIKGQTLDQIYGRFFQGMEEEQKRITEALDRYESEMQYIYVPGVADFMRELRGRGVKIAIVTSSNEKKMANVYAAHPELIQLCQKAGRNGQQHGITDLFQRARSIVVLMVVSLCAFCSGVQDSVRELSRDRQGLDTDSPALPSGACTLTPLFASAGPDVLLSLSRKT